MISILGLIIGIGGILLGNVMEGGHVASLMQPGAALIVMGGTLGATLLASSYRDFTEAIKMLPGLFFKIENMNSKEIAEQIVEFAKIARKESILALEKRVATSQKPFFRDVMRLVIDGVDPQTIRKVFETKINQEESRKLSAAKVFSDAGGYSPTIGIIGAVLGLIHVMNNLTDTAELGRGIAVAFVATIYGIALANLILIPIGSKFKKNIALEKREKQMILDGGLGILNGLNPYVITEMLNGYLDGNTLESAGNVEKNVGQS
jgi:chemotaxis protein MotA